MNTIIQKIWKIDPFHSKLIVTVTHLGILSVFGLFQKFDASIISSKPDFSEADVTLSVDVLSVNTEGEMRDYDLRSPGFFDVAKYPVMKLESIYLINMTGMKDRFKIIGAKTKEDIHYLTFG